MDGVRGIGFDLDHTLAIDNGLERVALLRLLEILLRDGGRAVGTFADEIESIEELLARQRHGEFSIDDAVARFVAAHDLELDQTAFRRQRHQERLGHDVADQAIDTAHADLSRAAVSNSGKPTTLL